MFNGIVMGVGFGLGLLLLGAVLANLEAIAIGIFVLAVGGVIAFYWGGAGVVVAIVGCLVVIIALPLIGERTHVREKKRLKDEQEARQAAQIRAWQAQIVDLKTAVAANAPFPGKPQGHLEIYPHIIKSFETRIAGMTHKPHETIQ
jgi:hypothetical protein